MCKYSKTLKILKMTVERSKRRSLLGLTFIAKSCCFCLFLMNHGIVIFGSLARSSVNFPTVFGYELNNSFSEPLRAPEEASLSSVTQKRGTGNCHGGQGGKELKIILVAKLLRGCLSLQQFQLFFGY